MFISGIAWAFVALLLAASGVGYRAYRSRREDGILERLIAALLPLWVVVITWDWVATLGFVPIVDSWSAARLAPSLALRHGYKLYSPPNIGPALGWIYPPVATLAYMPATLFRDPTWAVLAGRCLSLLFYFAPAAWILVGLVDRQARPRGARGLLLVSFALLTHYFAALRYCSTEIHADAPALGLAALAVGVMARSRGPGDRWRRGLALVLAALAVWTKQLTAPVLLIVLPAWALLTGGLRGFFLLVVGAVAVGLASMLVFLTLFDARAEIFNILVVPSRHPWRVDSLVRMLENLVGLEQKYLLLLILLAVAVLGMVVVQPWRGRRDEGGGLRAEPWALFLLVGLAELPLSLLGYVKVGGDDNSLGYTIYFLTLASLLMVGRLIASDRDEGGEAGGRATWLALGLVGLDLVLALLSIEQTGVALIPRRRTWRQEQAAVVHFLRAHRGEVYFPWNPLEHLAVEGRAYHFEYAVYDRKLAGFPLGREHFLRYIPPRTRLLCFPNAAVAGDRATFDYLRDFEPIGPVAELPGWGCYRRKSATADADRGRSAGQGARPEGS